ncbi:MAG: rRNA maturation RNase YbeY [Erysipelotrichaceae bacterium]
MEINIVNNTKEASWEAYASLFEAISTQASTHLKVNNDACLSVIFVDDAQIFEINQTYRNIAKPTDVISFALKDSEDAYEMMDGEEELGDIFINIEAVVRQAADYGHSLHRETCFLFAHGLLHLLGYDHMSAEEEAIMFPLQDEILHGIADKEVL